MTEDPWVWVTDLHSGHAHPTTRDAVALDPDRFRVDEEHPVRDDEGRLLPIKFRLDYPAQADPDQALEAATTEAKEAE